MEDSGSDIATKNNPFSEALNGRSAALKNPFGGGRWWDGWWQSSESERIAGPLGRWGIWGTFSLSFCVKTIHHSSELGPNSIGKALKLLLIELLSPSTRLALDFGFALYYSTYRLQWQCRETKKGSPNTRRMRASKCEGTFGHSYVKRSPLVKRSSFLPLLLLNQLKINQPFCDPLQLPSSFSILHFPWKTDSVVERMQLLTCHRAPRLKWHWLQWHWLQWHSNEMFAYSDTFLKSRLTFHIVKVFLYSDTVRSFPLTVTLFQCPNIVAVTNTCSVFFI